VDDAATVMSEVMKTMMRDTHTKDELTMYATYVAVRSDIARNLWDHGTCTRPDLETAKAEVAARRQRIAHEAARGVLSNETPPVQTIVEWPPR
jgi:hypothetical protein